MKEYVIFFLIGATLLGGSFYMGTLVTTQKYLKVVTEEIKKQKVTDEKVKKFTNDKLCSIIGGKLSEDNECL